jgi:hypothetical protein
MLSKKIQKRSNKKQNTIRKSNPSIIKLALKYKLYGSKSYDGKSILEHSQKLEIEKNRRCIESNLTWLGSYEVAKIYEKKETRLYEWEIKSDTRLIKINKRNEGYLKKLFNNNREGLKPLISLSYVNKKRALELAEEMNVAYSYLKMSKKDRAWYEFAFAYGYISLKEQYEFLLLLKLLLSNKLINMNMRNGESILSKIERDVYYYRTVNMLPYKHKEKYNRISFYKLDQSALTNLCSLLPKNISGVYQPNEKSFWFPNLLIYRMNIEEYVLFNPHKNLRYVRECDKKD